MYIYIYVSYIKQQIASNNGVENLERQRGKPLCWVDEEGEYCSVRFVGYVGLFFEFGWSGEVGIWDQKNCSLSFKPYSAF